MALWAAQPLRAQTPTVGLIAYEQSSSWNGLTLFAPITSTTTYLIDNCGRLVHTWPSRYQPGQAVYLLDDGSILHTANVNPAAFNAGGKGGLVERIAWDGSVAWSYRVSDDSSCQHHDARMMPNGNVLVIAWEKKSAAEARTSGRTTLGAAMWSEKIIEVKPQGASGGEVVWEWHAWDHLVQAADSTKRNYGAIAAHPELVDINIGMLSAQNEDWLHFNAIDYNAELDQILVSTHNANEIWIIDHGTTTAEAAGHTGGRRGRGGDLLFRWGNPANYGSGAAADHRLFGQHNAQWIAAGLADAGRIMIFNNQPGGRGPTSYSSVDIIEPVATGDTYATSGGRFLPDSAAWRFIAQPPSSFFAMNISGAQRLPNGNTLICEGTTGELFEVTPAGTEVWRYINPVAMSGVLSQGTTPQANLVFRCLRYGYDHPAFAGRDLSGTVPVEKNPYPSTCSLPSGVAEVLTLTGAAIAPNPAAGEATLYLDVPRASHLTIRIADAAGRAALPPIAIDLEPGRHTVLLPAADLSAGAYIVSVQGLGGGHAGARSMMLNIVR